MFKLRVILCCTLLAVMALPAFADEMVSLKVGYQSLTPSGTLAGNQNGVGTQIDVEKDLNFDDSEDLTAEIAFQLGISRLSLNYLPVEYSGTGSFNGTYNGQSFTFNDAVQSKVKLNIYDIGYTLNLINLDDLPVRIQLGPEIAVKVVDAEVDFKATGPGVSINESDSATVPIPTLGARARFGFSDFVAVVARAGYMEYDGNSFLDAEAQVEFSPLPLVGIYAGYRTFQLKVDESDLALDVDFSGPFVGALVRF